MDKESCLICKVEGFHCYEGDVVAQFFGRRVNSSVVQRFWRNLTVFISVPRVRGRVRPYISSP